MYIGTVTLAK